LTLLRAVRTAALIPPRQGSARRFGADRLPWRHWLAQCRIAIALEASGYFRDARLPKLLGKLSIPVLVACLQTVMLGFVLVVVLEVRIVDPGGFAMCMLVSALAFLLIVVALSRLWGDAGKALAMILLAVQMASSGGILPVELSGSFYAQISPWLPMTWVVKGLKASMFGAYEGDWGTPLMLMVGVAAAFLFIAAFFGRWEHLPRKKMQPALDL